MRRPTTASLVPIAILSVACVLVFGCRSADGGSSDLCRLHPEDCHNGQVGAFCIDDYDCQGFCCTDTANCAGGMCTFDCDDDFDCPRDTACEHHMCFYLCIDDLDCAEGQSCEHGDTVCEWP